MCKTVHVGDLRIANNLPLTIIAGPCQLETLDHALMIADKLAEACAQSGAGFIFKGSFDKANRTSLAGIRGVGLDTGLNILTQVKAQIGCPVLTDVHTVDQCAPVAACVDILQIPAFLCRQTDLLLAAGETGKAVNIKKGQFLAPWDMPHVAEKVASTGNENILLTERGTSFGYNTLVNDMRSLPIMSDTGYPVIMDATHSVQQPGGRGGASGGQRKFAPVIARAAVAVGVAGVFLETHENPGSAPSDGPNMVPLSEIPNLAATLMDFDKLAKANTIPNG
jgi:2-dehydro-3-deoxyphosphooctonate aldolase (KDO 8-P synthase)